MSHGEPGIFRRGLFLVAGGGSAIALLLFGAATCNGSGYTAGDGGADQDPFPDDGLTARDSYINPCAPGSPPSVSGKVYAPNGQDPVAGAAVYVGGNLSKLPQTVGCQTCAVPTGAWPITYSGADGRFKLSRVPNGKTFKVGVQKGHFRRVVEVKGSACADLALTKDKTTLPGKSAQYGPSDTVPSIAVVSGAWDKLENVLDKLGVKEKTIYNGRDYGSGADSLQALLQNAARMKSHHIILINCGTKFESLVTSPGPAQLNLLAYVRDGGRLFTTDLSYDYVEQVFPEFIDFEGSLGTPASTPEEPNAAELGTANLIIEGTLHDSQLSAWLALPEVGALLPSKRVQIVGFMTGWAVQKAVSSSVVAKTWVSGPVKWVGGFETRPLTASYEYVGQDKKGCGRVIFSSYHTHGDQAVLLPQERILEYLLLEIGVCGVLK